MRQWKDKKFKLEPIQEKTSLTSQQFINQLPRIMQIFPTLKSLILQFTSKIDKAACPQCTKNKYLLKIALQMKSLAKEADLEGSDQELVDKVLNTYFLGSKQTFPLDVQSAFDASWLDQEVGVGFDLIDGLTHCFQCCKKHLSRAKALQEQLYLGYPDHKQMMFNQFTEANARVQEAYSVYWDILGQIDMASTQLAGQVKQLDKDWRCQILELANQIRFARLAYQRDINNPPNWNQLRLKVQKLQNKITNSSKSAI